jgi:gas vesicle protein
MQLENEEKLRQLREQIQ